MKIIKLTCALLLTACISVSHAAVIHITDSSGNLLGAENVLVDGTLYDVAFLDGSCVDLYNGCDDFGDFLFNSQALAILASEALLDTVFIDSSSFQFDTQPFLTSGCTDTVRCVVLTPFGLSSPTELHPVYVRNLSTNAFDAVLTGSIRLGTTSDTTVLTDTTYAVWTTATDVPEPRTVILLSLGLVGLSLSRYKKPS